MLLAVLSDEVEHAAAEAGKYIAFERVARL